MALRQRIQLHLWEDFHSRLVHSRFYSLNVDWKKLRPMIHKRIKNRAKDYPLRNMVPVAYDLLNAREVLKEGVSTLINIIPIKACKFCPEVYIGDTGHLIQTCHGYQRRTKNQVHRWTDGRLNDILVPVEAFHLHHMFQDIIKHDQRFDFDRVPAVLELCCQAGAEVPQEILYSSSHHRLDESNDGGAHAGCSSLLPQELKSVAQTTLEAWERLRLGVQKLLLVYPAKVCQYCSEVHIGPSGHKARLCGVFKFESWRGTHFWKKAEVDDLVPQKVVWHRRPQDPQVLLDNGRGFYGHAPAVVELCSQAGATVPSKYFCMMKVNGLHPS
ncbi:APO protein 4, mitochondrial isoform X2 [Magnolia sinica]|nr:APO protein 4, mitochondrial isoform X2 [Magnolia sinica]XP_058092653.1 APO protein 4, mitochondrial isoform X2 [Magnolia sinica]XP_058092659.1 APO protein 4, mitochondrial isoform X2 [Magnolia sinica]XP_058092666.1 APO protein 4, mitochondrial isoform X2 [Magnolia sinica]